MKQIKKKFHKQKKNCLKTYKKKKSFYQNNKISLEWLSKDVYKLNHYQVFYLFLLQTLTKKGLGFLTFIIRIGL